jgi:hypothetical protein
MNKTKVEYIELNAADIAGAAAPRLTEADRRLLARSNIPGTELYRENHNGSSTQARVALGMAMTKVG